MSEDAITRLRALLHCGTFMSSLHRAEIFNALEEADGHAVRLQHAETLTAEYGRQLVEKNARVLYLEGLLNTPELRDFATAVAREAAHQRLHNGAESDAGKTDPDWFWLLGHLAGKALHAWKEGDREKALHHTISSAAMLANWHAALTGADTSMRPGIAEPIWRCVCGKPMVLGAESCTTCAEPRSDKAEEITP